MSKHLRWKQVKMTIVRDGKVEVYLTNLCPKCDNESLIQTNYCSRCGRKLRRKRKEHNDAIRD